MHSYQTRLRRAAGAINTAEALVISGGAGLSAAAGLAALCAPRGTAKSEVKGERSNP